MSTEIRQSILDIIKGITPMSLERIKADTDLADQLGFDSVTFLELISSLEVHFRITFADEDLEIGHFQTPRSIEETVRRYGV